MSRDPRIDVAIEKSAPFAQPVLRTLRDAVHQALPQVEETIKWGRPFFLLEGRPFAMMAAFKAHAIFGFWRGQGIDKSGDAGGQYGRLTSPDDLPPNAELIAQIRAVAETLAAPPTPRARTVKPPIAMPGDFAAGLAGIPEAGAGYDGLTPGAQREYLEWIVAAKRPETRAARIAKAIGQLSEGKKLNWKYESC